MRFIAKQLHDITNFNWRLNEWEQFRRTGSLFSLDHAEPCKDFFEIRDTIIYPYAFKVDSKTMNEIIESWKNGSRMYEMNKVQRDRVIAWLLENREEELERLLSE